MKKSPILTLLSGCVAAALAMAAGGAGATALVSLVSDKDSLGLIG